MSDQVPLPEPSLPAPSLPDPSLAKPAPIAKADFDEAGYLRLHPDVAAAIRERKAESGYKHYLSNGLREGRVLPGQNLGERNHLTPIEQTHEQPPPPQAAAAHSFDTLLISPHGLMISGWIDDSEDPVDFIRISGGGWHAILGNELLVRDRRPAVEEMRGRNKHYLYGYFSFLNIPAPVAQSGDCITEIFFRGGACMRSRPKLRYVDDLEIRNDLLGALVNASFYGNPVAESFAAISGGFADQILKFNLSLTRHLSASPYVERFGPQDRPVKGSIIVCLYGRSEFLFLQNGLYSGLPGIEDYEFIYVSNSPELAEPLLREARTASMIYGLPITIMILSGNTGFGGANNAAAQAARSDRLLIVNPDVFPYHADWAKRHTDLLAAEDPARTRLFGVPLYYDDGSLMHGGMYFETDKMLSQSGETPTAHVLGRVEHYGKGAPVWAEAFIRPRPVPAVTGAFISIERSWFEKLGGFNESFIFGHYEDADLCLKSIEQGTLPWLHDIRMWHLEGKGSTRMRPHEGGSLINRWLFTKNWSHLIDSTLRGPAPTYPGFETSSPFSAMSSRQNGTEGAAP